MPYAVCQLLYPVAHRVNLTSTRSQPGKHHAPILHMARATERQSEWSRVVDRFSKGSRVSSRSFLRVIKKKKKKKKVDGADCHQQPDMNYIQVLEKVDFP